MIQVLIDLVEPEDYAQKRFDRLWPVTGQRAILGVVEDYANNHRTMTSKNLWLFVEPFTNAKVYICLSQARLARRER